MSSEQADPVQKPVAQALRPGTVPECHAVIQALSGQIAALQEQLTLLQERVSLNSRNSSKPPSSDGPGSPRKPRPGSGRSRGAQPGHKGHFRELLDAAQVDAVQDCLPPSHCPCGGAVQVSGQPLRHQVFDLPAQIRPDILEYQLYGGVCAHCKTRHLARLPEGVPRSQIGPRALALIGVLGTQFHLTQHKIRDLLARLLGVDFSLGAISAAHGKVAAALHTPVRQAVGSLAQAAVLHLDETRYPREGSSPHWVWACVQPRLVTFSIVPSRARYVFTSLVGERPAGIVVSDRYAAYGHLEPTRRQVCWAHLLRDFERMGQRTGAAGRVGRRLLGLGCVLFRWRDRGVRPQAFERLQRRVHRALQQGLESGCRRTAATCANVLKLEAALWTFTREAGVEPTNNAAEQALRVVVLKRKISGPVRSRRGADFIANGYSVMLSCQRQGRDLLGYINEAVLAWINKTAPPSLMPLTG